ncbi:MAG: hypothetical protein F4X44_02190 [Gammaproteobacteria bacterium]|nr:hypothetical protein [Gammaproteobacteria bacterium]
MNEPDEKVFSRHVLTTSDLTDEIESSTESESPTSVYSRYLYVTVRAAYRLVVLRSSVEIFFSTSGKISYLLRGSTDPNENYFGKSIACGKNGAVQSIFNSKLRESMPVSYDQYLNFL